MAELIDKKIGDKKRELLSYYRYKAKEVMSDAMKNYSNTEYKERASFINKNMVNVRDHLVKQLEQVARKNKLDTKTILEGVLMITYTNYVAMLEARNEVWPYEYMTFARRIGELWEPFCQLCWKYSVNKDIHFFTPPLFKDVKETLTKEIEEYIEKLKISQREKSGLKFYYQKVWNLVTSGEIKLELDLHFTEKKTPYVVDFKSGFSSNEKGNTNRLLLVASIYNILEEKYKCLIFVRSSEDRNNHYLQTLKNSNLWEVYTGEGTYKKIQEFTGYNLLKWMAENINWEKDFNPDMYKYLKDNNLTQYLEW